MKKKDKSVTLSADGKKLKLKLAELEYYDLQAVVLDCIFFYDYHSQLTPELTGMNYEWRAALSFFMGLKDQLLTYPPKITWTRSEAYLFWGWVNCFNPSTANQPSFKAFLMKIHQKLS